MTHPAWRLPTADISRVPLDYRDGTPFRRDDVCRVVEGFTPPIGDAIINDQPGLLLIVEKQRDANRMQDTSLAVGGTSLPARGAIPHE